MTIIDILFAIFVAHELFTTGKLSKFTWFIVIGIFLLSLITLIPDISVLNHQ